MKTYRAVTSFLYNKGKVLIVKRSRKVGWYRGLWSGISGFLEKGEKPHIRALTEIREETGMRKARILRKGRPVSTVDRKLKIRWIVYPHLVGVPSRRIKLDWENVAKRWIRPGEIGKFKTVPSLVEALGEVLR